jgi:hypothetical protein
VGRHEPAVCPWLAGTDFCRLICSAFSFLVPHHCVKASETYRDRSQRHLMFLMNFPKQYDAYVRDSNNSKVPSMTL